MRLCDLHGGPHLFLEYIQALLVAVDALDALAQALEHARVHARQRLAQKCLDLGWLDLAAQLRAAQRQQQTHQLLVLLEARVWVERALHQLGVLFHTLDHAPGVPEAFNQLPPRERLATVCHERETRLEPDTLGGREAPLLHVPGTLGRLQAQPNRHEAPVRRSELERDVGAAVLELEARLAVPQEVIAQAASAPAERVHARRARIAVQQHRDRGGQRGRFAAAVVARQEQST